MQYNSEIGASPTPTLLLPPAATLDAELPSLPPGRRLDPVTFSLACPTRLHSLIRLHSHLHLIRILCASTVAYACTHPAHWPGWLDIHRPAHIDRARRSSVDPLNPPTGGWARAPKEGTPSVSTYTTTSLLCTAVVLRSATTTAARHHLIPPQPALSSPPLSSLPSPAQVEPLPQASGI